MAQARRPNLREKKRKELFIFIMLENTNGIFSYQLENTNGIFLDQLENTNGIFLDQLENTNGRNLAY